MISALVCVLSFGVEILGYLGLKQNQSKERFARTEVENELREMTQELKKVVDMQAAKIIELSQFYKELKRENSRLLDNCMKLSNHNVSLFTEKKALKKCISRKKGEPFELVEFVNPFNCESSCGFSAIYFILEEMKLQPCNAKFIMKVLYEAKCGVGNCRHSLSYLCKAGLIKEEKPFPEKITNDYTIDLALKDVIEKVKDQSHPALLLVDYDDKVEWKVEGEVIGHCVVVMPSGNFIDVQNRRYWKPETDRRISLVEVLNVNENTLKDWKEECGQHNCKCEVVSRGSNCSEGL